MVWLGASYDISSRSKRLTLLALVLESSAESPDCGRRNRNRRAMKRNMYRPVLMGLTLAALLISALAATSYPAHAALSAHAAISSDTPVPAAPSNLTARAVGATSVQLTWTNNAGNQSRVVISLDGQESVDLQGATVSSYTWNGLSPNTQYWFYVASKIYGTPGNPTGYGNTQSAWVGPAYATTVGTQPSTSPAPQPSTSPAPQPPSTSPGAQPSTSPAPQPPSAGSGVPTTLPTQPSPTFVCVTGPGGSCLQPGAGLPVPQTWTPRVPGWVTSGVTGGCVAEFLTLDSVELWTLFEKMGDAIQFDESNGNFFVLLSAATGLPDYCSQLGYDLLTGKPVPQTIDFARGAASPQDGAVLDSVIRPAGTAAAPSVFQPVPASQLASIEQLPFLRQRFGYAVAQVGAAAALSQKYPAGWGAASQKSVVCRPQQGGYRCPWSYQLNGAHHSGYVLVAVTAGNYRLGKVTEVAQAVPASPASSLSPLWYISIAAVVVIVAIVVAVLRRRRRATATAQ
jgi:Fibronectin type III domain